MMRNRLRSWGGLALAAAVPALAGWQDDISSFDRQRLAHIDESRERALAEAEAGRQRAPICAPFTKPSGAARGDISGPRAHRHLALPPDEAGRHLAHQDLFAGSAAACAARATACSSKSCAGAALFRLSRPLRRPRLGLLAAMTAGNERAAALFGRQPARARRRRPTTRWAWCPRSGPRPCAHRVPLSGGRVPFRSSNCGGNMPPPGVSGERARIGTRAELMAVSAILWRVRRNKP